MTTTTNSPTNSTTAATTTTTTTATTATTKTSNTTATTTNNTPGKRKRGRPRKYNSIDNPPPPPATEPQNNDPNSTTTVTTIPIVDVSVTIDHLEVGIPEEFLVFLLNNNNKNDNNNDNNDENDENENENENETSTSTSSSEYERLAHYLELKEYILKCSDEFYKALTQHIVLKQVQIKRTVTTKTKNKNKNTKTKTCNAYNNNDDNNNNNNNSNNSNKQVILLPNVLFTETGPLGIRVDKRCNVVSNPTTNNSKNTIDDDNDADSTVVVTHVIEESQGHGHGIQPGDIFCWPTEEEQEGQAQQAQVQAQQQRSRRPMTMEEFVQHIQVRPFRVDILRTINSTSTSSTGNGQDNNNNNNNNNNHNRTRTTTMISQEEDNDQDQQPNAKRIRTTSSTSSSDSDDDDVNKKDESNDSRQEEEEEEEGQETNRESDNQETITAATTNDENDNDDDNATKDDEKDEDDEEDDNNNHSDSDEVETMISKEKVDIEIDCDKEKLWWTEGFLKMKKYYAKHGHDNVLRDENACEHVKEWKKLTYEMGRFYLSGKGNGWKTRYETVNRHFPDFDWGPKIRPKRHQMKGERKPSDYDTSISWDTYFQMLQDFKKEHGHSNVPWNNPEMRPHSDLAAWVQVMREQGRRIIRGIPLTLDVMTPERFKKMDDFGFAWLKKESSWNDKYQRLKQYKEEYGDCLVPKRWPKDYSLGVWVFEMRRRGRDYLAGKTSKYMTDERFRLLEELGFTWYMPGKTYKSKKTSSINP